MFCPKFVDHVVLRIADVGRTERFYNALLGEPKERIPGSVLYAVGDTLLFFTLSEKSEPEQFEKEDIGLNHLAFGVRTLEELREIGAQLNAAGIAHSGIGMCRYGNVEFIWLDDPDGIRVEFYRRPEGSGASA